MVCRIVLLLAFLTAFPFPLWAINNFSWGATGGVLVSLPPDLLLADENRSYKGFIGGVIGEMRITSLLSARTGLMFRQEGTWLIPLTITDINGQDLGTVYPSQEVHWFEIPLMAKITPFFGSLRPYALAGINACVLTKASYKRQTLSGSYEVMPNSDEFNSGIVGMTFGAGVGYNIPMFAEVFIEGRYARGFNGIHRRLDWSNPSVSFCAGFLVHL